MNQLAMEEVLTISKVLLESRAMTKNELEKVINHLLMNYLLTQAKSLENY